MTGRERAELYGDCAYDEDAFHDEMVAHRLRLKATTGRYSSLDQPPLPESTPEQDEAAAERASQRRQRHDEDQDEHPEPWTL